MLVFLGIASSLLLSAEAQNSWNDPTKSQYHIQTDEGPERYFRYQTQNGQYRKEKRLQDGTVVGTYAWIDENGFLIQRDYIADQAGYRIINNKNVFVGKNVNVGDAVKATKKINSGRKPKPILRGPASHYLHVTSTPFNSPSNYPSYVEISPNSISSPKTYKLSVTIQPPPVSTTVSPFKSYLPQSSLDINNMDESSTTLPKPNISYSTALSTVYLPGTTPRPELSSTYLPQVYHNGASDSTTPASVYLPSSTVYINDRQSSSTPSNIYLPTATDSSFISSTTIKPLPSSASNIYISSTPVPLSSTSDYLPITPPSKKYIPQAIDNSLDYSGEPQYDNLEDANPYIHQNGPTYPLDKNGHSFNPKYYKIGNGYEAQYPFYNGISVTNDGFRYYIPRAYQEEQNLGYNQKSGSFGYIDPFGIRRVIYYNAGPDGFKHRKNNRYVGFNATPYDPRPYK